MAFVFMSVPLFNLIVVNERAQLGSSFSYDADRYMENIIRRDATRCFAFQATALITGVLLLIIGPLGIMALWSNWVLTVKMLLLFGLMGLLSFVHLRLQPKINAILAEVQPNAPVPRDLPARMNMQVYARFKVGLTVALIALAGLFAWRVNKSLIRFGWI